VLICIPAVLIALIWVGAQNAISAHYAASRARSMSLTINQAQVVESAMRGLLLNVDQTLRILRREWERDPAAFDLPLWQRQLALIDDISFQIFAADEHGRVVASSRPEIIGNDITRRDYFAELTAANPAEDRMSIGRLVRGITTGRWQLNMARRLARPDGSFAGIIAASFDPEALGRLYDPDDLGRNGLMLLVGIPEGDVRAQVRPAARHPAQSVANSPIFAAMAAGGHGVWTGPSPIDGVVRIHAFRELAGRGLVVAVGVDEDEALAASLAWEHAAHVFASSLSLLVLLGTFFIGREQRAAQRREAELARDQARISAAQAEAQAKTTQLEATLTGMTDGVMMVDSDLRLIAWNERFSALTGVPREILHVGLPMQDILYAQAAGGEFGPVDVDAEVRRRMGLLTAGHGTGVIERLRPDGSTLELRRNHLRGGGFVTVYTDITRRRSAEGKVQQNLKMAAIGRLTAGVAHDFNNLLASVIGNAEMLEDDLADRPDDAHRAAVILEAASRGAMLVRQLLAFSRNQPLALAPVDLNTAISAMQRLLETTLGSTIELRMELSEQLWPALVDKAQFENVVLNLVINARDAIPPGDGQVTIATKNTSVNSESASSYLGEVRPGDYVAVAVIDTGSGMSEAIRQSAFEPFFTTKPPGKGSGLGLSQAYAVAKQAGGGVHLLSEEGHGTTVRLLLPRATAGNDRQARGEESAASAPFPTIGFERSSVVVTPRRILLVDDQEEVRETLASTIRKGGYSVLALASGIEALRFLERGMAADLLIADVAMPQMHGMELARAARAWRPSLPIILTTGGADTPAVGDRQWMLQKPFRASELLSTIREAMDQGGTLVST
jgi:signal transduction histidine kinase